MTPFGVKRVEPLRGSERFLDSLSRIPEGNPTTNGGSSLDNARRALSADEPTKSIDDRRSSTDFGTPQTFAATGTTTVNGLNPEMKEVISDMDYFVWEENTAIWTKGRSKISSDIGQKGPLHTVILVHTAEGNVIVVDWSYRQFLAAELKNVRLYHGSFR